MISQLTGNIENLTASSLTLITDNIGYDCRISLETYTELEKRMRGVGYSLKYKLYIENVYRAEALPVMTAFLSVTERQIFRNLLKIHAIGLNMALSLISGLGIKGLLAVAQNPKEEIFRQVKGIGTALSKQLVIDAKKIVFGIDIALLPKSEIINPEQTSQSKNVLSDVPTQAYLDAIEALQTLGWKKQLAISAIDKFIKMHPGADVAMLVKLALTK